MIEYQGENFKYFLKSNNISADKAATLLGKNRVTVYQYFKSKSLSRDVVSNILNVFKVSEEDIWGEEAIKNGVRLEAVPLRLADPYSFEATNEKFYQLADGSLIMQVPIITQRAYAGYMVGFADPEFYDDLETIPLPVDKVHGGTYLAFEVSGDSMVNLNSLELAEQSIFPGRIAIGRDLPKEKWKYRLHTHNYDNWIIVHRYKGILIKQISNHRVDEAIITIHSLNPEYEDEELHLNDIEQIFSVVQIVTKKR